MSILRAFAPQSFLPAYCTILDLTINPSHFDRLSSAYPKLGTAADKSSRCLNLLFSFSYFKPQKSGFVAERCFPKIIEFSFRCFITLLAVFCL